MHKKFARKLEWKRQLRIPRHRWEYNVKIDVKDLGVRV
jgi:hypothetical protein